MTNIFIVCPTTDGWCVRDCQRGETLAFSTGGEAERRARALAAAAGETGEVWVHDRAGQLVGRWVGGGATPAMSPAPLDAPQQASLYLAA